MVAKGDAEAMVEINSNLWDIASGMILVEEAGGKISSFDNEPWKEGVKDLVITNGSIHNEILKLLK
jgi:myo-inositol-1(or 4)-monophosphatase